MIGTLWSRVRNHLYDSGLVHIVRPDEFVISIGNLTWGGTGKTALTAQLAKFFVDEGIRVGVLSRGYGRRSRGVVVVSDGRNVKENWDQAGDEPYWIAKTVPNAFVVAAESRTEGLTAFLEFQPSVILMDDAFQHRRVARDLDLVLIDASEDIGSLNVLPFGKLREPLDALHRASAIILSHSKNAHQNTLKILSEWKMPIFHADYKAQNFEFKGKRIAAFCGIGSPKHFRSLLLENGAELVFFRDFPDHHIYTADELSQLQEDALKSGAEALVTTAKDAVKIDKQEFRLPFSSVPVELVIEEDGKFNSWLRQKLASKKI